MIRTLIRDDTEAKAIADAYGASESMLADAARRLPEALAAKVGVCVCAKRSAPVANLNGPFEFVFITYMDGFVEGENGWAVVRWSEVTWDDMPAFAEELIRVERELLPHALGQQTAETRLETHRKAQAQAPIVRYIHGQVPVIIPPPPPPKE